MSRMHYGILRFFQAAHLPAQLRSIAMPFGELANRMADELPEGAEVGAGLRKLLEAKDCFVRAALSMDATKEADRS